MATLRKKVLIGYGVTLTLMVVVLVWAVWNIIMLGRAGEAILRENYASIIAAGNMIDSIERHDSATLLVMLGYNDEGLIQFRENENNFLQWLGRAKDNITVEGEAGVLSEIEREYSRYLVNFSKLREVKKAAPDKAGEFYHETVLPSFIEVRTAAVRLRTINQDTMFAASRRAEKASRTAIVSTAFIAIAAIAIGLWFSLLLSKRLVRPIIEMIKATEALAEGDYSVQVPMRGPDELASLADDFNMMARKLGSYHRLNVDKIVTEKRKSDAVLRSIEDGIVVVDAGFQITNMNPEAGKIFGVSTESAVDKHFLEITRNERIFELMKQAATSGKPPTIEEGKDIISLGEGDAARFYMFDITPVASKEGEMLGVVLLLRDVTRLKELDRMKSEFVMTASHQLKTPLQTIGMSIELLREGADEKLDQKQRDLLEMASEELARLKSLIGDLLDLSRIESGKLEMEIVKIPPRVLVDKAIELFETPAQEQNIKLTGDVPEGIDDIYADPNKITWVLSNLLANALRYAKKDIIITAREAGQWVYFSVADDGEGIPPEYQSRIFEKFVKVEGQKSVGGTGLGLAICREVVRAHKGTIWVESAPHRGTTFIFTLPAQK